MLTRSRPRVLMVVMAMFAMVTTLISPAHAAPTCTMAPKLDGSFAQPKLIDDFTDAQLSNEINVLTGACMTDQILQWTADTKANTTVYPSGLGSPYTQSTKTDVVGRVLTAADNRINEYLGLQINDDWWAKYANDPGWLNAQATAATNLAADLNAKYGTHPSFAGWYLSFEVDNWNFTTQASWTAMANFYSTVAGYLHTLTPGKPVVISPFFNTAGGQTSSQWTTMWQYILANAPIDVIALQDGIGAGHAQTSQLAEWFGATKAAIPTGSSTQLWADAETFTPDFNPLGIGTVVADLKAEAPYVTRFWSFSYDHYDSPLVVNPLYDKVYRDYLSSGTVQNTAPTAPTGLTATARDPLTISLSWTASTDATGVVGYQIFRNGTLVKSVYSTATTFADGQLDPGTAYTYQVAAFNAAGVISAPSGSASATTTAAPSNPNNLAAGKTYTASVPASPSYPDPGTKLTDGVYGTTSYTDPAWQGRNTGNPYSFTVDLGAVKTINEVDSDWLQVRSVFIFLPSSLTVAVSTDGTAFTDIGTMSAPNVGTIDQTRKYRLLGLNTTGRYVRLTVTPASSAWSFTDELEVRSAT